MELIAQLLTEHSKKNCDLIYKWAILNSKNFDKLTTALFHKDKIVVQRAAWPLSYAAIKKPQFVQKHLPALLPLLRDDIIHKAVKRNILRFLKEITFNPDYDGMIMNTCFELSLNLSEPIAIRAFSLHILGKMALRYPDIKAEIRTVISSERNPTPAWHSTSRKIESTFAKKKGCLILLSSLF